MLHERCSVLLLKELSEEGKQCAADCKTELTAGESEVKPQLFLTSVYLQNELQEL